jgi:excisionase family DNA binding protein
MTNEQNPGPLLFSVPAAARELSLSVKFLRLLAQRGSLRVVRVGRRVLVQKDEILRISREGLANEDGAK